MICSNPYSTLRACRLKKIYSSGYVTKPISSVRSTCRRMGETTRPPLLHFSTYFPMQSTVSQTVLLSLCDKIMFYYVYKSKVIVLKLPLKLQHIFLDERRKRHACILFMFFKLTQLFSELSSISDARDSEMPLKQIKSLLMDSSRDSKCRDSKSRELSRTLSTDSSIAGSLSSFELLHAGLIETMLKFLTPQPSDRYRRLCHKIQLN